MAEKDFTGASFYEYLSEGKLMAGRCLECATIYLPPRPLCPSCRTGKAMVWTELSGGGALAAFTVVTVAPSFMAELGYGRDKPYCVGIVRLDEGPMISARIVGVDPARPDSIQVGAPVRLHILPAEEIHRPVLAFELA